jgi:uncharacterized protein (DUF362 family)
MQRRQFLALGVGAGLARAQQQTRDTVTATATQDKTPRVGIVLSSFKGSADHDGTPIPGLANPRPRDADLTAAQVEAMVRRAIEMGDTHKGDLRQVVTPDDWVAIKPDLSSWPGRPGYVHGMVTDPRIVSGLIAWLAEKKLGGRFTIADAAPAAAWDADFDGLSYRRMVADFARRYPGVRFEIQDFSSADAAEAPLPGKAMASRNPDGIYRIPSLIQQVDRLISVAPLKTDPEAQVRLTMANYLPLAQGTDWRKKGSMDEVIVDLFSYHPADYAIAGGCWCVKNGASIHSNLVVAGFSAMAVDAIGASLLGCKPADLTLMKLAWKKGFGIYDLDSIWTRGSEIEEASV